jgi:cobalamin biosynthesis protein CobD/CbiB
VLLPPDNVSDIAHAIQLALAPVFLLTGIAALLGVMTNRLARIIDRGRYFEQNWGQLDEDAREGGRMELKFLEKRRKLANRAIAAGTLAALLVCLVVATLFLEALLEVQLRGAAGVFFFLSMVSLVVALSMFLREIFLATHSVRVPRF